MDKRRILSVRPKIKKGRRDGGDGSKKPGISSSVNSSVEYREIWRNDFSVFEISNRGKVLRLTERGRNANSRDARWRCSRMI